MLSVDFGDVCPLLRAFIPVKTQYKICIYNFHFEMNDAKIYVTFVSFARFIFLAQMIRFGSMALNGNENVLNRFCNALQLFQFIVAIQNLFHYGNNRK